MPYLIILILLLFTGSCQNGEQTNPVVLSVDQSTRKPDSTTLSIVMGQFNPEDHSDFVIVEERYADRPGMYLQKEVYAQFIKMWEAARSENINLQIRSATRNFEYQKGIWERKWSGVTLLDGNINAKKHFDNDSLRALKILEYSAMPGASRHHWGTEVDLNSFNNSWFEKDDGLKLFTWLENNAHSFGFCRPYTQKDTSRRYGYNEEKWHWSYKPLSANYTSFAKEFLRDSMLNGFSGAELCQKIGVVDKYVLGIDHSCK